MILRVLSSPRVNIEIISVYLKEKIFIGAPIKHARSAFYQTVAAESARGSVPAVSLSDIKSIS